MSIQPTDLTLPEIRVGLYFCKR